MDIHRLPDRFVKLIGFAAVLVFPICLCAKETSPRLAGYVTAPVRYVPLNKMIVAVTINSYPANLLVDIGVNQMVLDADAAQLFDVDPAPFGRRYIGATRFNGRQSPIAWIRSLAVGGTNLGSTPVILTSESGRASSGPTRIDGTLGADMLVRHQAVINCRTKLIYFKHDRSPPLQVAAIAAAEKFTRVPLRREQNGRFTVPFSMGGRTGRLFVDTGAFVTTFDEALLKSLGIVLQPARVSARFSDGVSRQYTMGQVNDLAIGDFHVPPGKFGAAVLPRAGLNQAGTSTSGILGMDLLYESHAIIDFGGMNLFLK